MNLYNDKVVKYKSKNTLNGRSRVLIIINNFLIPKCNDLNCYEKLDFKSKTYKKTDLSKNISYTKK